MDDFKRKSVLNTQNNEKYLNYFVKNANPKSISPFYWKIFYKYIINSYKLPQYARPSVSELSEYLQKEGFDNHAKLSVLYAHGLYILALNDEKNIYQGGFNP